MLADVKFAKIRGDAKIPSKRAEDAGFDVYACFDEDYIVIKPHETKIIPTCIASACDKDYCFIIKERGSTGSKGIAVRMGVVDSGYRDGWLIGLTNTTDKRLFITKFSPEETREKYCTNNTGRVSNPVFDEKLSNDHDIYYPYEKAIAQALVIPVPYSIVNEISYEELCKIESERGNGKLGSSNK